MTTANRLMGHARDSGLSLVYGLAIWYVLAGFPFPTLRFVYELY